MSTMPVRSHEPEAPRSSATIGKSVIVKGQIFSREDLVVDGEVEGTVEAQEHRVTIGPNGRLTAGVCFSPSMTLARAGSLDPPGGS